MYIKNTECEVSQMEEAIVLVKKDDNTLHILNETAAFIWEHIEEDTIEFIVDSICSKFAGVSREVVQQDVETAIGSFVNKGLFVVGA